MIFIARLAAILVVFFGSIVAGLMRGFMKEIIALITWIAAFAVSIAFSSRVATAFTSSSADTAQPVSMLAIGASFIALFVAVLLIGSLLNYFIASLTKGEGLGFGNRLLGGLFGLARGFLVNLILLFLVQLSPISQQPVFAQSQLVAAYQPVITWIDGLVEPGLEKLKADMGHTVNEANPSSYLQQLKQNFQQAPASDNKK